MNMAAWVAFEQGDLEDARNQWLRVRELAVEIGDVGHQAAMTVNIGLAALTSGDYRTALEYSTEAADLFRGLEEVGDSRGTSELRLECIRPGRNRARL